MMTITNIMDTQGFAKITSPPHPKKRKTIKTKKIMTDDDNHNVSVE